MGTVTFFWPPEYRSRQAREHVVPPTLRIGVRSSRATAQNETRAPVAFSDLCEDRAIPPRRMAKRRWNEKQVFSAVVPRVRRQVWRTVVEKKRRPAKAGTGRRRGRTVSLFTLALARGNNLRTCSVLKPRVSIDYSVVLTDFIGDSVTDPLFSSTARQAPNGPECNASPQTTEGVRRTHPAAGHRGARRRRNGGRVGVRLSAVCDGRMAGVTPTPHDPAEQPQAGRTVGVRNAFVDRHAVLFPTPALANPFALAALNRHNHTSLSLRGATTPRTSIGVSRQNL